MTILRTALKAILLTQVALAIAESPARAQNYAAFTDDSGVGFDAVAAHIGIVSRFDVSLGASAWCGIDEGTRTCWLQVGWRYQAGYTYPQKYIEYVTEDGNPSYPIEKGDAVAADYEIERDGSNVRFYIGGFLVETLNWADFDDRPLCKAQYGAEVHFDPYDHVPGTPPNNPPVGPPLPAEHCHFTDVEVREISGSYQAATFVGTQGPVASCYNVSRSSNNFEVWDKRGISVVPCPP